MTELTPKEEQQIHDFARDVRALVERQVREEVATAIEERGRAFLPGHPVHPYVAVFAGIARGQAADTAAGERPLLDPRSFDRPGQRAAARMLNDDDYPTFTAAEVASWQKSQGITAPAVEQRPVTLATDCANCGHTRNWHDRSCIYPEGAPARYPKCGCTNFAPKGGAR